MRLYDGKTLLFDARDVLVKPQAMKGFRLVKMEKGPLSYRTSGGTKFYRDHPFQYVPVEEVDWVLSLTQPVFRLAKLEEVEDYYTY
jgi:hypothetical protein